MVFSSASLKHKKDKIYFTKAIIKNTASYKMAGQSEDCF